LHLNGLAIAEVLINYFYYLLILLLITATGASNITALKLAVAHMVIDSIAFINGHTIA